MSDFLRARAQRDDDFSLCARALRSKSEDLDVEDIFFLSVLFFLGDTKNKIASLVSTKIRSSLLLEKGEMKMKTPFVVEKGRLLKKKSTLFRRFKKAVSKSAFTAVFSAENVINTYTFRTAAFTHTTGTPARRLFLSLHSRAANDVQEEEERYSSLSFFLYSHPRVHKLFSIIIIHNS